MYAGWRTRRDPRTRRAVGDRMEVAEVAHEPELFGVQMWSYDSVLDGEMSLTAETMLGDVRCDCLVSAPTSEAEAKRAIRDDLIELVTVVGVVCKFTAHACFHFQSTTAPRPDCVHRPTTSSLQNSTEAAQSRITSPDLEKLHTPKACSTTCRTSATMRGLDVTM